MRCSFRIGVPRLPCQAKSWTLHQFRRLDSNQQPTRLQRVALPFELHRKKSVPAVGLEPTSSALRKRHSACRASPAFRSSQCWCRANSTKVQSLNPLPRAWLKTIQSQRWDSNPLRPLYGSGARPVEHRRHFVQVAGGSRTHNGLVHNQFTNPPEFGHSASTWIRTRNTAFAGPDDLRFTIEASVPRPGVEPGPALSKRAMMSVSPSGQQAAEDGVEPSTSGVKARRSPAELPRHRTVAREGFEPSRPVGTAF